MSLQEYEAQLAEIEEMLAASPDDPSLLSLKSDLLELIAATLGTTATTATAATATTATTTTEEETPQDKEISPATVVEATAQQEPAALEWSTVNSAAAAKSSKNDNPPAQATTAAVATTTTTTTTSNTATITKPKKKKKTCTTTTVFTIPADLEIRPHDSKYEVNRKKRATAALRKQHEAQVASQVATAKQQSWQAFASSKKRSKKSKGGSGSSMFQTDSSAKVGVVGQRRLTKFEGPKKHK